MIDFNLIIILGATASGKTKLAVQLAQALNGEIISADSRQVFKHMDIGTGKDLQEYQVDDQKIPYHLIDILEAGDRYHVDAFKNDFYKAFDDITKRGKVPVLCGGTGMYIHSLLQKQDYTSIPVNENLRKSLEKYEKDELIEKLNTRDNIEYVDLNSKKRIIRAIEIAEFLKFNSLETVKRPELMPIIFGLKNQVEITRAKILTRLDERLKSGMIEEVRKLIDDGISKEILIFYGLEYKFIVNYLEGQLSYDELKLRLGTAICQYAKRQNTFFRKMEKDKVDIIWLNANEEINQLKQQILNKVSIKIN
ncbi:tRNA (adenosine(37)-N6)-dimethylallyltransferase MiaA [Pedobacter chinensis]|uniref:tRNA dimethylallyltransferase n=1 Tax=Pedobacter chinensis TaxID=2282421 RepID=A0A369Q270_9SPHI|nr:tRNA (adenosine(37)-N6)-dimethylallyltransferase MiaA [Pedobacter chinensis]RDC58592.1 tRNA (adenosine(37)-N6)-dimethylallyltransferase MiaA [Pedobacter chinensis]